MDALAKVAKNTGILIGMELGVGALEVLVSVLIARYLAPEGFGLMAYALALASLFSIVPGFGMSALTTRDLARDPRQRSRYLSNGLVAKAGLTLLTLLAMGLVAMLTNDSATKRLVVILAGLSMVLEVNLRFTLSFFRAAQRMNTVALTNLALHAGWVVVALAVVALRGSLIELLGARVLVYLAALVSSVWLIDRRLERIRWTFEPAFMRQMVKASLPFAVFHLFVSIYVDIDMVMLSWMRGDVMTGWYAAAQKFRRLFTFLPTSVSGAMLPAMSKLSGESPAHLIEALTRGCKYLTIIALPIAGGICVLADRLVLLLYGAAYEEAIPALRVLIWTILFAFLNSTMSSALLALNRERQVSWALGAGALFNIVTNLIAIPAWGHVGAAVTTVLSEGIVLLVQLHLLATALPQARPLGQLPKPLVATFAMMGVAWLGRGLGLVSTILGSALFYVTALVVSGVVGRDDWTLLNGIVRGKAVHGASR